jgi:GcrA cell cycle regulator
MTVWTPERIAEVTRLWGEGLTTAEIGKAVGVTKNAVVGKAHRLGLPPRPSPIRRSGGGGSGGTGTSTAGRKAPRTMAAKPAPVKPVPQLALSTFGQRCKWPFGHPGEANFHFCGSLALVNKPYCPEHYQKAYLPARPKGEARDTEDSHPRQLPRRSASAA